ncbi:MAG: PQQ-binding-like beta-propeller repeat protein [Chloroflexaceae bacterium]
MALIKKAGTTKSINTPPADKEKEGGPDTPGTAVPGTKRGIGSVQTLTVGTVLQGRYTIEGPLGIGGMSMVYLGRDLRFKDVVRPCAIKEMYQSAPDSQTRMLNLKNFERESGLLATLQHPAIPKVYDFFEENGRIYLVLELIAGKDLESVLEDTGNPLDEVKVCQWAMQICDVLSHLHNHQPEPVIFRDMKPSNVMLTPEDRIVLIDFGIARNLTRTDRKGTMIGTEGYSPPEQYRGVVEPQSDLYALGATLHHLLSGNDPRMETPFTFHERPLRQINPAISPEMEAIVMQALEYDLTARWSTAEEFKQALLSVPGVATTTSAAPSAGAVAPPILRKSSESTELIWSFTCEDEVRSSPCVNSGMLFIGCYDTNLYALDLARGEFRWKYATEGGVSSSPVVWEDSVIFGSEDGAVYALDKRRGKLSWTFRTGRSIRSSPRLHDRIVFVGSDDQHFYALDGLRGTMIWKYRTWMPIRSSGFATNEAVFIGGNDGHVYCLDIRNGGIKWKQRTQQPVISSPVFSDGLVFVGSMDNNLYALDGEGGWPAWRYRTGHYVNARPCVFGTRVFVGSADGNMYALEKKNGRLAWKYETDSQIASSPCIDNGRIYFGAIDGNVYCLDVASGALVWKYQTGAPVVSSPTILDGIVYIGSMDHQVYALKA